jgi:hypothetical protein
MRQNPSSTTVCPAPGAVLARLGALVLVLLGAAGCSSTPSGPSPGEPLRVTLLQYSTGARFELVGESFADRSQYYSQSQADQSRKFLEDQWMAQLVGFLDDEGLGDYGQAGRAPSSGGPSVFMAFEVERSGQTSCWLYGPGTEKDEAACFRVCMANFLLAYNDTNAFQTVDNPEGSDLFRRDGTPGLKR